MSISSISSNSSVPSAQFSAEDLVAMRRVVDVVPSLQGDWLAVVTQRLDRKEQSRYVHDLWRVPLNGDEPVCLSVQDSNDHSPHFRADGALAFISDRALGDKDEGASPKSQVWLYPRHGGDAIRLTDEPLGVSRFAFAQAVDLLVVQLNLLPHVPLAEQRKAAEQRAKQGPSAHIYTEHPVRYWDHWEPMLYTRLVAYTKAHPEGRVELTPQATTQYRRASWSLSPDGRYVAITPQQRGKNYEPSGSALELLDTRDGQVTKLADGALCWHDNPIFCPLGQRLAYQRTDLIEGKQGGTSLWIYDLESGAHTQLKHEDDLWFTPYTFDERGERIYGVADLDGQTPLLSIDVQTHQITRHSDPQHGGTYQQLKLLRGQPKLVGIFQSFKQPPEAFVLDLSSAKGQPAYARPELVGRLSQLDLDMEQLQISYHHAPTTDGQRCPYYVVKRADLEGKAPSLMWIHGGPIGQWSDIWHWRWNSIIGAMRGYVMVLPNPRGSTGLGQAWVEGIWGNTWGGQCFEDLMAVTDEVAARADVDETKMAAMGGSFGGYMTCWIGTQTDRFCCLINHAGIASLRSFHGVTDNPSYWAWMYGVSPYERPEELDTYSPLKHIQGWKSPTLIIHGQQDYRVPVGEALILFDALQWRQVKSKLLIYPDENHWILKPKNIISWYNEVFDFVDEHCHQPSQQPKTSTD